MSQLLRLHFRFSSKALLMLLIVIAIIVFIYSSKVISFNLITLLFFLIMYLPSICLAHLLDAKFSILMRISPVRFKQFVQSTFIYMVILFSAFLVPISFVVMYHLSKGTINTFAVCYLLWGLAFAFVTTGGILKNYFKNPAKSKSTSGSDLFFYIIFTVIPHALLCIIFLIIGSVYVGALITPIVCLFIFYRQYKASIQLYEQAEFCEGS